MRALKFNLSGETAFFKKPDVNTYLYFTYGNIHKIAVLGIIGAVIGLKGYNQQDKETYPEFYKELCNLKITIVPNDEKGYIPKKIQTFNNSVGYASQEEGGNLIVKEQWLEKPSWDIYILSNENTFVKDIEESFLNSNFTYIPYLGKNDHFANIKDVEILELQEADKTEKVHSLFLKTYFDFIKDQDIEFSLMDYEYEERWKYEEKLPVALEENTNQYITESFVFTNMKVILKEKYNLYSYKEKVLFFF
jgi:CRISPR-associated protein Cas5h